MEMRISLCPIPDARSIDVMRLITVPDDDGVDTRHSGSDGVESIQDLAFGCLFAANPPRVPDHGRRLPGATGRNGVCVAAEE